jgi:hypothetical protein
VTLRRRPPIPRRWLRLRQQQRRIADETDEHFAALVISTWLALPASLRRDLIFLWKCHDQAPGFTLAELLPLPNGERAVAWCEGAGRLFEFDQAAVAALSDDQVRALIAHEMIHAVQPILGVSREHEETHARALGAEIGLPWIDATDGVAAARAMGLPGY